MKTISLLAIIFSTLIFFSGCNLINSDDDNPEMPLNEKTAKLLEAENEFGFDLFQRTYASETDYENIMVSPLSVSLALAMTYNGANGETKTAMEETLKMHGLSAEDINETYYNLVNALQSIDPDVLLEIANAIFYRNDFNVEQEFVTVNQNYYNAEVSPLDFSSLAALNTINNWVADKTHNKIDKILDEISADQVMFLLNAIYFKGIWQTEFNTENTKDLPFYLENGETINIPTMQRLDTLAYAKNDLFSAIELSYGIGNYNMYVFLPEQDKSVEDIVNKLDMENWETWLESFTETESVDIKIPRLKYKYEIKLNQVLTDMGMGIAFTGSADFTGISKNGGLRIEYVKHKTFIEVNEEGTEAAAVTIVAIERTSAGPQNIPFHVNRPFLYAITEKDTGAILFIGTVKNPQLN